MYHYNMFALLINAFLIGMWVEKRRPELAILCAVGVGVIYLSGWQVNYLAKQQALADEIEMIERSMKRREPN